MTDFKVLRQDIWSGGLKLDALDGFDEDFRLGDGSSLAKSYPKKGAIYAVDKSPVTKPGPERPGRAGYKEPYFIANLLDHVACLDEKKSKAKKIRDKIMKIGQVALREGAVSKTRSLFRVKEYPDVVLVRSKLADALAEPHLTGIELVELADYTG